MRWINFNLVRENKGIEMVEEKRNYGKDGKILNPGKFYNFWHRWRITTTSKDKYP
jgi:hypothetical protein